MSSSLKIKIHDAFDGAVESYDEHADIQEIIAKHLIKALPSLKKPRVLEIGCGTGILTQKLFQKYPDGCFHITDISEKMVQHCFQKITQKFPQENGFFFVMDGENLIPNADYDLIVSSMSFQWFSTPLESIKRLLKKGPVYFSTLGCHNFKEWRLILNSLHLQHAGLKVPDWIKEYDGVFNEAYLKRDYGSGINFLKTLKRTGATVPNFSYSKLKYKDLKQALNIFDNVYQGAISWHIIDGSLPKYQGPQ